MESIPGGKPGGGTVEIHHRLQLALLEALEQVVRQGRDRSVADETLARFVDFTRAHFLAEEALMALADYPDTGVHAAAHARFLEEAREVQRAAATAGAARALASVAGLGRTLRDHINGSDAAFERWGEARRASPPGR